MSSILNKVLYLNIYNILEYFLLYNIPEILLTFVNHFTTLYGLLGESNIHYSFFWLLKFYWMYFFQSITNWQYCTELSQLGAQYEFVMNVTVYGYVLLLCTLLNNLGKWSLLANGLQSYSGIVLTMIPSAPCWYISTSSWRLVFDLTWFEHSNNVITTKGKLEVYLIVHPHFASYVLSNM